MYTKCKQLLKLDLHIHIGKLPSTMKSFMYMGFTPMYITQNCKDLANTLPHKRLLKCTQNVNNYINLNPHIHIGITKHSKVSHVHGVHINVHNSKL
jgi:hypothetical protein